MTNKQKIEKWMDKQIKANGVMRDDLVINKQLKLVNASRIDYVHLYGCLYQVAEILELPVERRESETISGAPYAEDYIMYKGVKFLQVVPQAVEEE